MMLIFFPELVINTYVSKSVRGFEIYRPRRAMLWPRSGGIDGQYRRLRKYRHRRASQVKSSRGATRPRGDHPDPNFFLPSSLRGLWRGLVVVGRQEEPQRGGLLP